MTELNIVYLARVEITIAELRREKNRVLAIAVTKSKTVHVAVVVQSKVTEANTCRAISQAVHA